MTLVTNGKFKLLKQCWYKNQYIGPIDRDITYYLFVLFIFSHNYFWLWTSKMFSKYLRCLWDRFSATLFSCILIWIFPSKLVAKSQKHKSKSFGFRNVFVPVCAAFASFTALLRTNGYGHMIQWYYEVALDFKKCVLRVHVVMADWTCRRQFITSWMKTPRVATLALAVHASFSVSLTTNFVDQ